MGVMIVVPSFAEAHESDEPVIPRAIARGKSTAAPKVRQRVDHPGSMQPHGHPEKDSPQEKWQTAKSE
jgi:hypothetical protein